MNTRFDRNCRRIVSRRASPRNTSGDCRAGADFRPRSDFRRRHRCGSRGRHRCSARNTSDQAWTRTRKRMEDANRTAVPKGGRKKKTPEAPPVIAEAPVPIVPEPASVVPEPVIETPPPPAQRNAAAARARARAPIVSLHLSSWNRSKRIQSPSRWRWWMNRSWLQAPLAEAPLNPSSSPGPKAF